MIALPPFASLKHFRYYSTSLKLCDVAKQVSDASSLDRCDGKAINGSNGSAVSPSLSHLAFLCFDLLKGATENPRD